MGRPAKFDREDAVRIALEAFWRDGYEASSVKALAEAMGITRSSFYNAFETREALFELALEAYVRGSPDSALAEAPGEQSIRGLLTRTFRAICAARAADPEARGCLIINTVAELGGRGHPVGEALAEMVLKSADRIEALLRIAVARGEIAAEADVPALAVAVQNLMVGLNVLCKAMPDEDRLWAAAKATLSGLGLYDPAALERESVWDEDASGA